MSLLVLLITFLKNLISQVVILHSRGLVIVQVWHWYVNVARKIEFMILLFVSIGISLRRIHEDILDPQINEGNLLCSRDWNQEDLSATIFLELPGLLPAEQQIPTQRMALTLEIFEEEYPQTGRTHIYTDRSVEDAVRKRKQSGVY